MYIHYDKPWHSGIHSRHTWPLCCLAFSLALQCGSLPSKAGPRKMSEKGVVLGLATHPLVWVSIMMILYASHIHSHSVVTGVFLSDTELSWNLFLPSANPLDTSGFNRGCFILRKIWVCNSIVQTFWLFLFTIQNKALQRNDWKSKNSKKRS